MKLRFIFVLPCRFMFWWRVVSRGLALALSRSPLCLVASGEAVASSCANLIVAGVEGGPIRGTEPIPLFVESIDLLIGILTLLGVLQYAPGSSVNANLVRGASTFDVE